jgi:hypothetical protein
VYFHFVKSADVLYIPHALCFRTQEAFCISRFPGVARPRMLYPVKRLLRVVSAFLVDRHFSPLLLQSLPRWCAAPGALSGCGAFPLPLDVGKVPGKLHLLSFPCRFPQRALNVFIAPAGAVYGLPFGRASPQALYTFPHALCASGDSRGTD